ncbi:MAG: hypothetical protein AB1814_13415 [Thermodesulfobacteriota bacterium]
MGAFLPGGMAATLHILPFRDVELACRHMLALFPRAPSVPRLSLSVRMYMDGLPCLVVDQAKRRLLFDLERSQELERFYQACLEDDLDHFALDRRHAPGFYRLLEMLAAAPPPELALVHLELPGPVTWGLSLADSHSGRAAWYDPVMREVLVKALSMKARWQEREVQRALPGVGTMVTLGEPSLGMVQSAYGSMSAEEVVANLAEVLAEVQGLACVHCCSNMDWSLLMKAGVGVINFDAYQYADKLALYAGPLREYLERGGLLAWGIVPVNPDKLAGEDQDSLRERLELALVLVARAVGRGVPYLVQRSFITPCCTPSTLSEDETLRAWELTGLLSRQMAERHLAGPTA